MFNQCQSLESLDLTKFDTSEVTSISNLFSNCLSLKTIDISEMNFKNVVLMDYTFRNCTSLTNINLTNFKTDSAQVMKGLFFGCSSLKSIEIRNLLNVSTLSDIFNRCTSLRTVTLSAIKVIQADRVFNECNSLKYIDLSNFNANDIKFYINDFFPIDANNVTLVYNSSLIGALKNRIPNDWNKMDLNGQTIY